MWRLFIPDIKMKALAILQNQILGWKNIFPHNI